MSEIDYSKFSYKDYKRSRSGVRIKKGRIRYNFVNYEEYQKHIPSGIDNLATEPEREGESIMETKETEEALDDSDESHIEDLRTKKKSKMTVEPRKKHNIKRDVLAVMIIIICFTLTFITADIISGGEIFDKLADVFANSSSVPVYYAVEIGSYSDIASARQVSELYRKRGAGGYVINDGTYRVIAAVYSNREDAQVIVTKLISDGLSGTIYEIKGAKVNYDKYGDVGKELETAADFCGALYEKLYLISNDLDKGEITENEAKIKLSMLYYETVSVKENFNTKTLNCSSDRTVSLMKEELCAYVAIIENLNNDKLERPSLLSDIRYSYTMIANSYCRLLRTIK